MLRGIHKASANWLGRVVMGIILGLIAISFAIWGVGDMFRGFGQSTVAKVGNTEIRVETFRQSYQDRIQQLSRQLGRPILPAQARALGLDRQLLATTVAETVLDERARSLRLALSDAEVARRIMEDPNFKGITGQFERTRFDQLLRQAGFTEIRFLAEQRRTSVRQQLIGTVSGDLIAPKAAAEAFNRYQNEQRSIEYVRLDRAQAGEIADPAPEVLAKYFDERKVMFRAPEYRKVNLLVLTPATLASSVEVSDADLRKAYEDRKAKYDTAERRHLHQIVFPNLDEAKAAAEKLSKGASFADLAAERGLKDADIDLGTIAKSSMVDRAAADAAFALKDGEVTAPVEGRFGIALVRVLKIEPGQTRSFEDVAAELKQEVASERARSAMSSLHDKVEDERLGGSSLAEIATKLKLSIRTIDAVDRSGRTPDGVAIADLPQGVDVLPSVFTADTGPDHDPLQVPGSGGYVWYEVMDIKAARERSLDEVKDQLLTRWRDEEIATRLRAKATEMLDKVKAGTPFPEVAAANNLTMEWRPGLKRGNPPAGISARALDEIFRAPKDAVAVADGATPTERIVFRVNEITMPTFDPESAEAKRIDEALRRSLQEELLNQYIARLEKEIGVTINQAALNQVNGASSTQN